MAFDTVPAGRVTCVGAARNTYRKHANEPDFIMSEQRPPGGKLRHRFDSAESISAP
ncbi:uncharacterized protein METZ01_LOCUS5047 [marine metagenome]|uniref:Uncharacterized protein n=1 Tax=marine metagenome TaxID=408172 RepID=A0A381NF81_9ZZZZ